MDYDRTANQETGGADRGVYQLRFKVQGSSPETCNMKPETQHTVVCLSSATASMEMVLHLLDLQPEDEVIVPAYTYTATASVTQHVGCRLVMVDSQKDNVEMDYEQLEQAITEKWEGRAYRLVIQRERRLDGEQDLWEEEYTYRCILTNDYTSTNREIVEFYNLRGGKERIFDDMNNGFGWARLPKSFMAENTVFLLLTALIRNFYKFLMGRLDTKAFGLKKTSRIKAFVFKFVSVPAKWIRTARHYELNIYTHNHAYQNPFALADG